MSQSYSEIEERITKAIERLDAQQSPNIAETARSHGVPERRLQYRFKHRTSRIDSSDNNKSLAMDKSLRFVIGLIAWTKLALILG